MRLRILLGALDQAQANERVIFGTAPVRPVVPVPGILVSLSVHGLLIVGLAHVADFDRLYEPENWAAKVSVRRLNLKATEVLYFAPPERPRQLRDATLHHTDNSGGKSPAVPAAPPQAEPAPAEPAPAEHAVVTRRAFTLPPIPRPKTDPQIVLQPPDTLTAKSVQRLPMMVSWAGQAPSLPRPKPKPFLTPGHRPDRKETPELAAPPKLDAPNRERDLSSLNIASAAPQPLPALAMPPSATAPVRVFKPPAETAPAHSGNLTLIDGEPVNLVVLSSNSPPPDRLVTVFSGINLAPLSTELAGRGDSSRGGANTPEHRGGGNATGSGTSAGSGQGARNPGGHSPSSSGPGGSSGKDAAVVMLGMARSPGAGAAKPVAGPHTGKNGVFDVVVVQSSSADPFVQSAGILKGRPLYTVYLEVGTSKPWILRYCLRTEAGTPTGTPTPEREAPIAPPYPVAAAISENDIGPRTGYLFIHGILTAEGRFITLTRVGQSTARMTELLQAIAKWEFRPATADQKPVAIEVLLIVPPPRT